MEIKLSLKAQCQAEQKKLMLNLQPSQAGHGAGEQGAGCRWQRLLLVLLVLSAWVGLVTGAGAWVNLATWQLAAGNHLTMLKCSAGMFKIKALRSRVLQQKLH